MNLSTYEVCAHQPIFFHVKPTSHRTPPTHVLTVTNSALFALHLRFHSYPTICCLLTSACFYWHPSMRACIRASTIPHTIHSLRNLGSQRSQKNRRVGFFPFTLTDKLKNLDLKKYQVFSTAPEYLETKNCLLFALEKAGLSSVLHKISMLDLSSSVSATVRDSRQLRNHWTSR